MPRHPPSHAVCQQNRGDHGGSFKNCTRALQCTARAKSYVKNRAENEQSRRCSRLPPTQPRRLHNPIPIFGQAVETRSNLYISPWVLSLASHSTTACTACAAQFPNRQKRPHLRHSPVASILRLEHISHLPLLVSLFYVPLALCAQGGAETSQLVFWKPEAPTVSRIEAQTPD